MAAIEGGIGEDTLQTLPDGMPMFDVPFSAYQRARGVARVSLGSEGQIVSLFQSGSAKAMIPRTHGPCPEVVFLNTSGGLTGGDEFSLSVDIASDATVMAATQTAERAYASPDGMALVEVDLSIGDGGTLYWLPQETILFEHSSLSRATRVSLGQGARFLGLETVVLGRAEMGEKLTSISFRDTRHVRDVAGRIRHAEQIEIDAGLLKKLPDAAGLDGAAVLSTLVYFGADAEDRISGVRNRLGGQAAASAWGGRLVIRAMGQDSWDVRQCLIPAIRFLTGNHLPRVWQT